LCCYCYYYYYYTYTWQKDKTASDFTLKFHTLWNNVAQIDQFVALWPFIWPFRSNQTWPRGGTVIRLSPKYVFFIFVGIHKNKEHDSESANTWALGAPLGSKGLNENAGIFSLYAGDSSCYIDIFPGWVGIFKLNQNFLSNNTKLQCI